MFILEFSKGVCDMAHPNSKFDDVGRRIIHFSTMPNGIPLREYQIGHDLVTKRLLGEIELDHGDDFDLDFVETFYNIRTENDGVIEVYDRKYHGSEYYFDAESLEFLGFRGRNNDGYFPIVDAPES